MPRIALVPLCLAALVATAAAQQPAPERIDSLLNAKLRTEGMEHSKLMWIEHNLTDVYGPRPIGSPNHKAAAEWAIRTMAGWGMKNAHLEPFTWRGIGWLPGKAYGFITSPVKANLKFEANPWSPSTKGTVTGQVVSIVPPVNPTEEEFEAYLIALAPKVKNGIIMVGRPQVVPVNFSPTARRTPDSVAKAEYSGEGGGRRGRGGDPMALFRLLSLPANASRADTQRVTKTLDSLKAAGILPPQMTLANLATFGRGGRGGGTPAEPGHLSAGEVNARIALLIRENLPALRLNFQGGGRIPGEIVAQNGAGQIYDNVTPQPPTVILRNDDAGRIFRLIEDGTPVTVELNMQNTYYPEGKTSYVAIAEIPGTDKADEVVMLGGHLDSWTSATGATDNAIGCAIMMEAARLLIASGAHPRRTIRVALWSGEEEGLLGSLAYVANHFGSAESPKPEFQKLVAYWNIDDGTGKVRGASVFGPPEAAQVVGQYIRQFSDWGMYGANPTTGRVEGGTDSGAFNVAGLPGISTDQDPIEYGSTTWHSNLDTYERIIPDDVMKNAVLSASVVYHLASRDAMLPRFGTADMPPVPAGRGFGGGRGGAAAALSATPHVYVVGKGAPFTVATPGVVGAARPGDSVATTATLTARPSHGRVTLKADGGFVYTPAAGFTGRDSFSFVVNRAGEKSEPAKVVLLVR